MTREFTGWHMLAIMVGAFTIIIGVNLTLAWNEIATFPGLETRNSYVVSQKFEADRAAQNALRWDMTSTLEGGVLTVAIADQHGNAVQPKVISAILGRATHTGQDELPDLRWNGTALTAAVVAADGYWNLRLVLEAPDGTAFRRRIQLTAK